VSETLVAALASALLSLGAWHRGSLSISGGIAAAGVGFSVWVGFGRVGFAALGGFFLTSTLLGRVGKARKLPLHLDYEKGDRRDAWQVLANGGVATALALIVTARGNTGPFPNGISSSDATLALAALASIASANADTWATELGVLWPYPPRSLWSWRKVEAGTSGAVSLGGLVAALGGASLIACIATFAIGDEAAGATAVWVTGAGFFGALVDSALGKGQRQYVCTACAKTVETKRHCNRATTLVSARWAVLNNDAVNVLANASAAAVVVFAR
jgi:uncharacterized protein (TIGR00297 family)